MNPKKKMPSDYGLYCFRISEEDRDELNSLLDSAKIRLNKNREKNDYIMTKNEIILSAIRAGLPLVKKPKRYK